MKKGSKATILLMALIGVPVFLVSIRGEEEERE